MTGRVPKRGSLPIADFCLHWAERLGTHADPELQQRIDMLRMAGEILNDQAAEIDEKALKIEALERELRHLENFKLALKEFAERWK